MYYELPESNAFLFSKKARWQSWLDVEAALAHAQSDLGMIPQAAAEDIIRHAHIEQMDIQALEQDMKVTMAPVLSIVHALAHACDNGGEGYVHWGATTQNIIVAGRLVQMKKNHRLLLQRLSNILECLAQMAQTSAAMPVPGRTNRKQALPITFGFKVASWIAEFMNNLERMQALESRTFSLVFGGAIGAMHSFGEQGDTLVTRVAQRLDLGVARVHSRANSDTMTEYVLQLSLLAVACGRMAKELYTLMLDEVGEVAEKLEAGVRGSSTMPHKDNPKHVVKVIALADRLRYMAGPALEMSLTSHEGDAASNQLMYQLLDDSGQLSYELLTQTEHLVRLIELRPERMYQNFQHTERFIASENLMMLLAPYIGRQTAHELVHETIRQAVQQDTTLPALLSQHPEIKQALSYEALEQALQPDAYTGQSESIALRLAQQARQEVQKLATRLTLTLRT